MTTPNRREQAPTPEPKPSALVARTSDAALAQVVETSTAAAAQMARTAIEARYIMAVQHPRDWQKVTDRIMAACKRPRFAEEARYRLPRGGEEIEGLSIRFAEEAVRAMGNLLIEANVIFDDDERRILRVVVTDLEANNTWPTEIVVEKAHERRGVRSGQEVLSTRKNSRNETVYRVKATDDEVMLKQNNLVSKAARTGILRFVPADVQEDALAVVKETLTKSARNADTLKRLVDAFARLGIERDQIEGYLGHSLDQMTGEEYSKLRGVGEALKESSTTWEEVVKGVPRTTARRSPHVAQAEYAPVKAEEINMANKPKMQGHLPPDPYAGRGPDPANAEPGDMAGEDDYPLVDDGAGGFRAMTAEERTAFDARRAVEEERG